MLTLERQNEIMRILKDRKSVLVSDLAGRFFTGESTIRRDLDFLEKQRLIRRTYGGAMLLEGLNTEIPFDVRERERTEAKDRIGMLAAEFVLEGDTIILDSSSTTYHMLKHLSGRRDLTVITNGLKTAMTAGAELRCQVFCTGGALRENSSSLVGSGAQTFMESHRAQKLFFSCRALSKDGWAMDVSDEEAALRRTMLRSADRKFLLCDQSKIGQTAFAKICALEEIDELVLDQLPEAAAAGDFQNRVRLVV